MKPYFLLLFLLVCSQAIAELKPFESDGCSAFPDGTFTEKNLWLECCVTHDLAYWRGGNYQQRRNADQDLKTCVAKIGQPKTAQLMLAGVRVGGSPYFPSKFRWGYGWPYPHGYKELDEIELKQVQELSPKVAVENISITSTAAEKTVIFYPGYGYQQDTNWILPINLWIYEEPDFIRFLMAKTARSVLAKKAGIKKLTQIQKDLFETRSHGFIADSESREIITIVFDNDPEQIKYSITNQNNNNKTDRNGNLAGEIILDTTRATALLQAQKSTTGWLSFSVLEKTIQGRGLVRLLAPSGFSIISDIDDTIKVTEIPSGEQKVLFNTFFKEFSTTPCLPEIYQSLDVDTAFHYVSGAPWQLFGPIAEFVQGSTGHYPAGSFHMKNVRSNLTEAESYQDLWKLLGGGSESATVNQKIAQISSILNHFPERQFILVGDSGEHDPKIFSRIRDKFPTQIKNIYIRDVVDASKLNPERLKAMNVITLTKTNANHCTELSIQFLE